MNPLLEYSILASGGLGLALAIGGLAAAPLVRRQRVRIVCKGLGVGGSIYTFLFILYAVGTYLTSS